MAVLIYKESENMAEKNLKSISRFFDITIIILAVYLYYSYFELLFGNLIQIKIYDYLYYESILSSAEVCFLICVYTWIISVIYFFKFCISAVKNSENTAHTAKMMFLAWGLVFPSTLLFMCCFT